MPNVNMPNVKMYRMPENLAQAILSYLATKPYNEVVPLIRAIEGLQVIDDTAKAAVKPELEKGD